MRHPLLSVFLSVVVMAGGCSGGTLGGGGGDPDPDGAGDSATGDPAAGDSGSGGDPAAGDPAAGDSGPGGDPIPAGDTGPLPTGAHYFPDAAPWYTDVSAAPTAPNSDAVITWLGGQGGFGNGRLQVDFGIHVLVADGSTPRVPFVPKAGYYTGECDEPVTVPLPSGGALEGFSDYVDCVGDCHLIVVDRAAHRLYESWATTVTGGEVHATCMVVWEMNRVYPPSGRGEGCTSADAAGFPIAPLLFTADEVAAGSIDHAIRFILPNSRMRAGYYVRPATHLGGPSAASADAPPYGVHFRLKASFDVDTLPNEGAKVVARALQRYGMLLSDGGNVALTAQSDQFTTAKWSGLLGSRDLDTIPLTAFEVVDAGAPIAYSGDCTRNP